MPILDGLSELQQLKSKPETADIAVMIVSAPDGLDLLPQARKLGPPSRSLSPFRLTKKSAASIRLYLIANNSHGRSRDLVAVDIHARNSGAWR